MSDFLLSILLGIVEGLTEFLPVSSTAHLRIVEAVLRLDLHDSFWKMYTIVIQLGAILALPVYFWRRILQFASTFPQGERGNRNIFTHPLSLTLIAFVITAVPSWALKKQIGANLESLQVMSLALYAFLKRRPPLPYALIGMIVPMLTFAWPYAFEARAYGVLLGCEAVALLAWSTVAEERLRRRSLVAIALSLAVGLAASQTQQQYLVGSADVTSSPYSF